MWPPGPAHSSETVGGKSSARAALRVARAERGRTSFRPGPAILAPKKLNKRYPPWTGSPEPYTSLQPIRRTDDWNDFSQAGVLS